MKKLELSQQEDDRKFNAMHDLIDAVVQERLAGVPLMIQKAIEASGRVNAPDDAVSSQKFQEAIASLQSQLDQTKLDFDIELQKVKAHNASLLKEEEIALLEERM